MELYGKPELSFRGSHVFLKRGEDIRDIGEFTKLADGTRAYISHRNRPEHFVVKYQGWGIAEVVFQLLKLNGFTEIHIRLGAYETLISKIADWDTHGIGDTLRGDFEPQRFLPERNYMKKKIISMSQAASSPKIFKDRYTKRINY